jgi:hypothetical protein
MEGDLIPCVIEKVIPSQGEGEQSTKSGGPWPYCPHPVLCCRLEKEFPAIGGGSMVTDAFAVSLGSAALAAEIVTVVLAVT